MEVLEQYVSFEESIKNSRFLSELFPCTDQNSARALIKEQKTKYSDATHVVHAFVIGNNKEICGMSDDGEPSGTAGRPVLDVLKGRNVTNVLLTVTRWFGGTLLGTGGLVKAYSGGAKQVLQKADSLSAIVEYVEKQAFTLECNYSIYKLIKKAFEDFNLFDIEEKFETQILITAKIQQNQLQDFCDRIKNLSNGQIDVRY